ncbi:S-layer homology domain-containing protein [Lysinibacillus yapensis]|uniref:S-layer homology domain-containing protein n=1 Tax=Ureibacillus yapensis TaxID=2304605 RepID=A0A396SE34_9BACL|nr:S-layer homology domain-containing protein [Lysinibacillus yapensis]RHW39574.1 S-layer homology domain-containing protein [Lysinibacillus yapensis]
MKKNTTKKLFNIAITSAMATGAVVAVAPTSSEAAQIFTDVNVNNTHYTSIAELSARGIINGYPDGSFKPKAPVQRNHAASILANVLNLDLVNLTNPRFKDVPQNYPYYKAIAALENEGIFSGYKDGTFGIKKHLTRGEMAAIIVRAFDLGGGKKTPFKDVANSPYKSAIEILYANNVTSGTSATTFSPKANVTRGEFASFLLRAEKIKAAQPTPSKPVEPTPIEPTPTKPEEPTPTTPVQPTPTNPGNSGGSGTITTPPAKTAAEVRAEFVGKVEEEIIKASEEISVKYVTPSKPVLENGVYNIDLTIEKPETTVADVQENKAEILPFITNNVGLVTQVQIGNNQPVAVTEENKAILLGQLVQAAGIDPFKLDAATLGDLAGKDIGLKLWVKDGGTTPLAYNLDFKE